MNNLEPEGPRIVPAPGGWYQVYKGSSLVASCPNYRQAALVLEGLSAIHSLIDAQRRIALLERTLELQLKRQGSLVHAVLLTLFGGGYGH